VALDLHPCCSNGTPLALNKPVGAPYSSPLSTKSRSELFKLPRLLSKENAYDLLHASGMPKTEILAGKKAIQEELEWDELNAGTDPTLPKTGRSFNHRSIGSSSRKSCVSAPTPTSLTVDSDMTRTFSSRSIVAKLLILLQLLSNHPT